MILTEHSINPQLRHATRNRRPRNHQLANRLLVRRPQRRRILDLNLQTTQRNAKVAVPARLVAQPVVVHIRLRDGTRHPGSRQRIHDASLGVDAQVGQIPRSERGRVQPGALGGEDQPQLAGGGPDSCSRGGVDAGEQVLRGEAAGREDAGFEVVGQLLEAADGGCGGGAVELCGGLGGDDDEGWG